MADSNHAVWGVMQDEIRWQKGHADRISYVQSRDTGKTLAETRALAMSAAGTFRKAKLVVPLAMTTAQRSPLLPNVPTLAESGIAGIDVTSWYGMLAPKGVGNDVRDAIYAVTKSVLEQPAIQEKLNAQGLTVQTEAPDVFAARIKRETEMWAKVIKARNISIQ